MRTFSFVDWLTHPLVFLVPAINKNEIQKEYLTPFDIPTDDVKVVALGYDKEVKKTSVGSMKQWITEELIPGLSEDNVKYLIVADSGYYKVLTGDDKADANIGYVKDCLYGPYKVLYIPNCRSIFYDPEKVRTKIKQAMEALLAHVAGTYSDPGSSIIKFEAYPRTPAEIQEWLNKLLEMNCDLTIDIEGFDLKAHKAGIGTISFCWNKHEGIAFPVDYVEIPGAIKAPFGRQERNEVVRAMLRSFFATYLKKAIYHNISYDVCVLIYQLYMTDILDTVGLMDGLNVLLRNWDDTFLITYLATNSCAGNELGLKPNSQEFSGNYSVEVADITTVPLAKLLRYNLVDGLSTWYVYEKYHPIMIKDAQLGIYATLFKPTINDIVQMQLTGLPLNMERVKEVKVILEKDYNAALDTIHKTKVVQRFTYKLNEEWVEWKNSTLKKKRVTLADAKEEFNPRSYPQLGKMLYEMLGLPILDYTDHGQPAVGADTLKKLINKTEDEDVKVFLTGMIDYLSVVKILDSFIPAMEDAVLGPDNWYYLVGSFKLGGTVSGRLSSSNPNLQNLPATGTKYAKLIKSCFQAPPGWIFVGLDFSSLEDRISALTTKDPNKLKVYTDGYDGHSLRAYAYFKDQMPDIDPTSVDSINSIQIKYKHLRQKGKNPTFALTYQGTWMTLVVNYNFSEELSKSLENSFKELYKVSIEWVEAKLAQAAKDGYVTVAFGLRVRTPLLFQVLRGLKKTPYAAEAEGRTAGNALGQSWCLLNERASVEFMSKVRQSQYVHDIKPCAHIHDAQYFLIRDNIDPILYTNEHLVEAVNWQDHSDIRHNDVHLGGALSLFWPTWADEIEIPNGASEGELRTTVYKKLGLE